MTEEEKDRFEELNELFMRDKLESAAQFAELANLEAQMIIDAAKKEENP